VHGLSQLNAERSACRDFSFLAPGPEDLRHAYSGANGPANRGALQSAGDGAKHGAHRSATADEDDRIPALFPGYPTLIINLASGVGIVGGQTAVYSRCATVGEHELIEIDGDGSRAAHPFGGRDLGYPAFDHRS
jgi:hypothetical protein